MKCLLLLILLFVNYFLGNGQTKAYEKQILNTCHIIFNSSNGSGLLYSDGKNLYLITAVHVLFDLSPKGIFLLDSIARVTTYPRDVSYTKPDTIELNLLKASNADLIKLDSFQDIVTIQIGGVHAKDDIDLVTYHSFVKRLDTSPTNVNCFTKESIIKINEINLGDDVAVFGFPTSLGLKEYPQFDYNRPLIRRGHVAGLNVNQGTIILDCPVFAGNSGGPVIRTYYDLIEIKKEPVQAIKAHLIGIVIEFIPLVEQWENKNYRFFNTEWDNSGYSVVVPIEYALKLIASY